MTHKATGNFVSFLSLSFVCITFELFFSLTRICATNFIFLSLFFLILFTCDILNKAIKIFCFVEVYEINSGCKF